MKYSTTAYMVEQATKDHDTFFTNTLAAWNTIGFSGTFQRGMLQDMIEHSTELGLKLVHSEGAIKYLELVYRLKSERDAIEEEVEEIPTEVDGFSVSRVLSEPELVIEEISQREDALEILGKLNRAVVDTALDAMEGTNYHRESSRIINEGREASFMLKQAIRRLEAE